MMSRTQQKIEELTYEAAFKELEEIVSALESDGHALEESLKMYQRGQVLASRCTALLEKAELKVQKLSVDGLSDYEGQV